ncbi:MAG: DUF2970 domain-containing protein [Rudaea sp.]
MSDTEPGRTPGSSPEATDASPPPATFRQVLGAVFWSFFGVRKGKAMQRDAVTIRPHQVILVGIAIAALLVFGLILLVRTITRGM